uniref:Uncharacterized protein n=1 Tax=Mucochytrium quahogii TaxID=96639 RepID=A0A7S2RLQ1_9STRA|mmetsp:Transcript_5253/g.8039  ORF Transcript_5253/g.8039 Transcript_5253/m.8039 type:complete len:470 (+) Transcript_5253:272-1681(+)
MLGLWYYCREAAPRTVLGADLSAKPHEHQDGLNLLGKIAWKVDFEGDSSENVGSTLGNVKFFPPDEITKGQTFEKVVEQAMGTVKFESVQVLVVIQEDRSIGDPLGSAALAAGIKLVDQCLRLELIILSIGRSCEFGDMLSAWSNGRTRVLCWFNEFKDTRQHVVGQLFSHCLANKVCKQGRKCTGAYKSVVDSFERAMDGPKHIHTFGMDHDGEPCLFPDFPARPGIRWDAEMFESKLACAAKECYQTFKRMIDGEAPTGKMKEDVMFRIGAFFGWLAILQSHTNHSPWKGAIYAWEYSLSGEDVAVDMLEELNRKDPRQWDGLCDFMQDGTFVLDKWLHWWLYRNERIQANVFQFYKLEIRGIGEAMMTLDRDCVISRSLFQIYVRKFNLGPEKTATKQHDIFYEQFKKLSSELDIYASTLNDSRPDESWFAKIKRVSLRRAYQLRFIWIHNQFRILYQQLVRKQGF